MPPRLIMILLLTLVAYGCSSRSQGEPTSAEPSTAVQPRVERFTGIYEAGWEREVFRPCGRNEEWWSWTTARIIHEDPRGWGRRLVVVEGEVSAPGRYGHLGRFRRQIVITRLVEVLGDAEAECPSARDVAPGVRPAGGG